MSQRDYAKEYRDFHAKPEQVKRRAARNKSRAIMKKKGAKVAGKDVDHKDHNPQNMSSKNLRVISVKKNRSDNKHKKNKVYGW